MPRPPPKKGGASPPPKRAKGPPPGRKHAGDKVKPARPPPVRGGDDKPKLGNSGGQRKKKEGKRKPKAGLSVGAAQQRSIAFLRWAKDIYELLEEKREVMVRQGGLMKKKTQRAGCVGAREFVSTVRGFSADSQVARTKGITQCPLSKAEVKFALGPMLIEIEAAGKVPPKKDDRVRIGDDAKTEVPMISWEAIKSFFGTKIVSAALLKVAIQGKEIEKTRWDEEERDDSEDEELGATITNLEDRLFAEMQAKEEASRRMERDFLEREFRLQAAERKAMLQAEEEQRSKGDLFFGVDLEKKEKERAHRELLAMGREDAAMRRLKRERTQMAKDLARRRLNQIRRSMKREEKLQRSFGDTFWGIDKAAAEVAEQERLRKEREEKLRKEKEAEKLRQLQKRWSEMNEYRMKREEKLRSAAEERARSDYIDVFKNTGQLESISSRLTRSEFFLAPATGSRPSSRPDSTQERDLRRKRANNPATHRLLKVIMYGIRMRATNTRDLDAEIQEERERMAQHQHDSLAQDTEHGAHDHTTSKIRFKIDNEKFRSTGEKYRLDFRRVFRKFDKNGDGTLTYGEFCQALKEMLGNRILRRLNLTDRDLRRAAESFDRDGDGTVEYREFTWMFFNQRSVLSALKIHDSASKTKNMRAIKMAFHKNTAKRDGLGGRTGTLRRPGFQKAMRQLGFGLQDWELDVLFDRFDVNRDGDVSLAEFLKFIDDQEVTESVTQKGLQGNEKERAKKKNGRNLATRPKFKLKDIHKRLLKSFVDRMESRRNLFGVTQKHKEGEGQGTMRYKISDPESVFRALDTDRSGGLDLRELDTGLRMLHLELKPKDLQSLFKIIDLDGNGTVSEFEFCTVVNEFENIFRQSKQNLREEALSNLKRAIYALRKAGGKDGMKFRGIFKKMDSDASGTVDKDEFEMLLKS